MIKLKSLNNSAFKQHDISPGIERSQAWKIWTPSPRAHVVFDCWRMQRLTCSACISTGHAASKEMQSKVDQKETSQYCHTYYSIRANRIFLPCVWYPFQTHLHGPPTCAAPMYTKVWGHYASNGTLVPPKCLCDYRVKEELQAPFSRHAITAYAHLPRCVKGLCLALVLEIPAGSPLCMCKMFLLPPGICDISQWALQAGRGGRGWVGDVMLT